MNEFEKSLNEVLVDTFNYIMKYEEESLRTLFTVPITVTEAHMMEAIEKNNDNVTISELASVLKVSVPTITVAVKKLVSKGLVTKVSCTEDGRRSIVSLTDFGKRLDRAHTYFHRRMVRDISGEFLEGEKEILLTALKKLSVFFMKKVEA